MAIYHSLPGAGESRRIKTPVKYTGKLLEIAPTQELFREPKHPYTQGLLQSIPRLGTGRKEPLLGIPGSKLRITTHGDRQMGIGADPWYRVGITFLGLRYFMDNHPDTNVGLGYAA